MAHYLPVLLVSVSTNASMAAVPDDSSLETQPRGQVDYLSHEWEEEDVWRSWRNMTKQKNEIVNGVRLENASWRTWWKQRNNLPTVSPETLNWLKDSDVTWLYGPLHTAVDWAPPPKPKADPTSVDKEIPNSVHERLGLSTPSESHVYSKRSNAYHDPSKDTSTKSILKHRSISELLTSDFPHSVSNSRITSPRESDGESEDESHTVPQKRPVLVHTQSESYLTSSPGTRMLQSLGLKGGQRSNRDETSAHSARPDEQLSDPGAGVLNSDLASSPSGSAVSVPTQGTHGFNKKSKYPRHITFNTFVEQCIAIEKPKSPKLSERSKQDTERARVGLAPYEGSGVWNGKTKGMRWTGRVDDEDDDSHDDDTSPRSSDEEDEDAYHLYSQSSSSWTDDTSGSESDESVVYDEEVFEDDESDEELPVVVPALRRNSIQRADDLGVPTSSRPSLPTSPRSQSIGSNSSESSAYTPTLSTDSGASSSATDTSPDPAPLRDRRRSSRYSATEKTIVPVNRHLSISSQSSNATIKIGRRRKPGASSSRGKKNGSHAQAHLTIAHIAPTMLKTAGVGNVWDSFGSGYGDSHTDRPYQSGGDTWVDGFGDDGYSDDGLGRWHSTSRTGDRRSPSTDGGDPNTSVELVYMPTDHSRSGGRKHRRKRSPRDTVPILIGPHAVEEDAGSYTHREFFGANATSQKHDQVERTRSLPLVVRTPPAIPSQPHADDPYDYFGGPDLGEDYMRGSRKRPGTAERGQSKMTDQEVRGRSRSRSRTPSPNLSTGSAPVPSSIIQRTSSLDGTNSPSLLSPHVRGRMHLPPSEASSSTSRGRSSTRTASSLSDRDRSNQSQSSSLGSLSPEGTALVNGAVYASGRLDRGRDGGRDRDPGRGGERGRDRTERRVTGSRSPEAVNSPPTASLLSVNTSGHPPPPILNSIEEENSQRSHRPTPANSPVVGFSMNRSRPSPPQVSSPTKMAAPSVSTSSAGVPEVVPVRKSSIPLQAINGTEPSVVGKAVGIVSSAGAYLGLWNTADDNL